MNKFVFFLLTAIAVLCLNAPMTMAGNVDIETWSGGSHGINLDHGDVVIRKDSGDKARITPNGTLIIAGKTITVNAQQKAGLSEYVSTIKDIEIKGQQLEKAATGFAASVVAETFAGLFAGEDEDKIDKNANNRAHAFKQKALPVCKDVQSLEHIQDSLAAGIPAFKPYAIIKGRDADDCEHDINSDN